ncbi:uncharacterized protein DS421_6g195580 [Arachis hypogaea]|nr:uncharacterized protein DS421_6g195580 [Arachis hypogaea]
MGSEAAVLWGEEDSEETLGDGVETGEDDADGTSGDGGEMHIEDGGEKDDNARKRRIMVSDWRR